MAEQIGEAETVYRHNCPALGEGAIVPRALMADAAGEIVLYYQNKCPFCSYVVVGTKQYARGVTPDTLGGYTVDMKIAEKLR